MNRNISSLRVSRGDVFKFARKGTRLLVPYEIGKMYAQSLLGTAEVPASTPPAVVGQKLKQAYKENISPWLVEVRA